MKLDATQGVLDLLPHASIATVFGLVEHLDHAEGGREDLYKLGAPLGFALDDLLPVVEAGKRLGLVSVTRGGIALTAEGRAVAHGDAEERKRRLRKRIEKTPLLARIRRDLAATRGGRVARGDVKERLGEFFSPGETDRQLLTALDWARYAGVYDFDPDADEFVLPGQR